jgi:hypothetical protein
LTSFVEPLSESVLATTSSIRLTRLEDVVPQANRLLLDRPVDHETVAVLHTHTLGLSVALTAVAFLIGLS